MNHEPNRECHSRQPNHNHDAEGSDIFLVRTNHSCFFIRANPKEVRHVAQIQGNRYSERVTHKAALAVW